MPSAYLRNSQVGNGTVKEQDKCYRDNKMASIKSKVKIEQGCLLGPGGRGAGREIIPLMTCQAQQDQAGTAASRNVITDGEDVKSCDQALKKVWGRGSQKQT